VFLFHLTQALGQSLGAGVFGLIGSGVRPGRFSLGRFRGSGFFGGLGRSLFRHLGRSFLGFDLAQALFQSRRAFGLGLALHFGVHLGCGLLGSGFLGRGSLGGRLLGSRFFGRSGLFFRGRSHGGFRRHLGGGFLRRSGRLFGN